MFVRKKDSELRCVLDYRALNRIIKKNRYPLPRIDDLMDALAGSSVYTGMDFASGYWQLRLSDGDVPKTAFRTPTALHQWRVLPMGLANAPSTFQAVMHKVFGDLLYKGCLFTWMT
jgi:hypothetical protein